MDGDRQLPAQRPLIEAPINITPGSKPCSAGLWKLLTEGDDGASAVRLIAINNTLRAECERVSGALTAASRPGPDEERHLAELMLVLVRHAPTFGIQGKNDAVWAELFGVYLDTLGELSVPMVEDAFVRWNRGELYPKEPGRHAFYPKPAELFALAQPFRTELRVAAYRARRALEYVEQKVRPKPTDEERAKIGEEFKRLSATLSGPNGMPTGPARPTISPQQMADRIRASAPPADDIGDVI